MTGRGSTIGAPQNRTPETNSVRVLGSERWLTGQRVVHCTEDRVRDRMSGLDYLDSVNYYLSGWLGDERDTS